MYFSSIHRIRIQREFYSFCAIMNNAIEIQYISLYQDKYKIKFVQCIMHCFSTLHLKGRKCYCLFIIGVDLNKEGSKFITGCNLR